MQTSSNNVALQGQRFLPLLAAAPFDRSSVTFLTTEWPSTAGCQPSASAFDTQCATCAGVMEAADGSIQASGRVTSSSKISFEPRLDAGATAIIMFDEPTAWEYVGFRRIRQIS